MKGTCHLQDEWYEPFSLCLYKAAKSWYRQLPKRAQRKWKLLSEALWTIIARSLNCPLLLRLNGYARKSRKARNQYGKKFADAADHAEHFLLNCGDDDLMDMIYPQRLDDIQRVKKIISHRLLGEKRK